MMHKTTSDTPHELEIFGRRSVTGIHRNRSCATAISSSSCPRAARGQALDQIRAVQSDAVAVA